MISSPGRIGPEHAGRSYPPTPPYEVSAAKVAEFARAIGDDNPVYAGPEAVAPPTFAAVIAGAAWEQLFTDPELGLALRRIVHGEQKFDYVRPLRVGDRVTAVLTVDKVRVRGAADFISTSVALSDAAGAPVLTSSATFVHGREGA